MTDPVRQSGTSLDGGGIFRGELRYRRLRARAARGYAITNPEGSDVKLYVDPRDRALIAMVHRFSLSGLQRN